jgi:peptidoglycan/LPS O-acetylase OafA/YrhL
MQAEDHSQHAAEGHWSGSAAVAISLVAIALLVAARRPGWRLLGGLLGATYLYLGVAALIIPDHDGSWGMLGGALALLAGGAYMAILLIDRRAGRRA